MAYFHVPDAILFEFSPFLRNSTRVGRTDGRTDEPTDRPIDGYTLIKRCENAPKNKNLEEIQRFFISSAEKKGARSRLKEVTRQCVLPNHDGKS